MACGSAGEMRELHADIEQSTCRVRILGGQGGCSLSLIREVLPRDSFDVGRCRQIDRRLRAFRWTFEEHPIESHDDRGASDHVVRPDDYGVVCVYSDVGALKYPQ